MVMKHCAKIPRLPAAQEPCEETQDATQNMQQMYLLKLLGIMCVETIDQRAPALKKLASIPPQFFKMLFLWFLAILDPQFSLVPPHIETNANEIGNWTIRGTATILKKFIRLTGAIPESFGSVCQRIPSLFRDWSFEMRIAAWGGNGGRGFWFYFTDELCPTVPLDFTGFCVWINSSVTDGDGSSPFYFVQNNGSATFAPSKVPVAGWVKLRSDVSTLRFRITRLGPNVTIYAAEDVKAFRQLFETTVAAIPDFGYFTVSSLTTATTDNNDLISIETTPLSPNTNVVSEDLTVTNRRKIENSVESRRLKKAHRRLAMSQILRYANLTDSNSTHNLTDAFAMVQEMRLRALATITVSELMQFIETTVVSHVSAAFAKIAAAEANFREMRSDMQSLWGGLRHSLLNLSVDIRTEMENLDIEARNAALHLKINATSVRELHRRLHDSARSLHQHVVRDLLWCLGLAEITAFGIYLWRKERAYRRKIK
jgi:mannose-binding lectin 1